MLVIHSRIICILFLDFLDFQSKRWAHADVKTFYFINLKETSKNSVQSLYYLFTKAGVLSLRNTRGAGTKKKLKLQNIKWIIPYFQKVTVKGEVCIGVSNKDSKMRRFSNDWRKNLFLKNITFNDIWHFWKMIINLKILKCLWKLWKKSFTFKESQFSLSCL